MIRVGGFLAIVLMGCLSPRGVRADCLTELLNAIESFRGIGYPGVKSYRVVVNLPDEEEEAIPLHELWRAPRDLVLRAAEPHAHRALVRSLALYLEPLYVARTSLLDADLQDLEERIRATPGHELECSEGTVPGSKLVSVAELRPQAGWPEVFEGLSGFQGELDAQGRLFSLEVHLTEGERGAPETLRLSCEYDAEAARPQPDFAVWTLGSGERVEIRTTFREKEGRSLPAERTITFPSRYDPGERESIVVQYGEYEIDVELADEDFEDPAAFRYNVNGLVPN